MGLTKQHRVTKDRLLKEMENHLANYIDIMVKQVCRKVKHQYPQNQQSANIDKTSIYSSDHLRLVYDKPRSYLQQMLKHPDKTTKGKRIMDKKVLPGKRNVKYSKSDLQIIQNFVRKVHMQSPKNHFLYIDFHHHMYFVYRNFTRPSAVCTLEPLTRDFLYQMKLIVDALREDDPSQFTLRIFAILREYCLYAEHHYVKSVAYGSLGYFYSYYEALLLAAKSVFPVFLDIEDELQEKYGLCWIDFNTAIFLRYFYGERVKEKVSNVLDSRRCGLDSPYLVPLMIDLTKLWESISLKVDAVMELNKCSGSSSHVSKDRKLLSTHRKLLSTNIWLQRSLEIKNALDLNRFTHHLFELIQDPSFFPYGPIINNKGECVCEECLISKFDDFVSTGKYDIINLNYRSIFCRKCNFSVDLNNYLDHLKLHRDEMLPLVDDIKRFVYRPIQSKCFEFVRMIRSAKSLAEIYLNRVKVISRKQVEEMQRNGSKYPMSKLDFKNHTRSRYHRMLLNGKTSKNQSASKMEKTSINNNQIKRNENEEKSVVDYKQDTEKTLQRCSIHPDSGSIVTCIYCNAYDYLQRNLETNEELTDEQLPIFENKSSKKTPPPLAQLPVQLQSKIQTKKKKWVKLEKRISLPSVPSNSLSTDNSSSKVFTAATPDISGLVAYIEGNANRNINSQLDTKKADKKKRQKLKKFLKEMGEKVVKEKPIEEKTTEKQKSQQQNIFKDKAAFQPVLEEQVLLQRTHERAEREIVLEHPKLIEDTISKKKSKKKRQTLKRMQINRREMVETIPAIVTVKRVESAGNDASVTITLKGYTADQDKLLTSLILDSRSREIHENNSSAKKKNETTSANSRVHIIESNESQIIAKNFKVTLVLDKKPILVTDSLSTVFEKQCKIEDNELIRMEREATDEEMQSLGNLRLPPGITITKVEGPLSNKHCVSNSEKKTIGNSGVIVVDTEQLLHKTEIETFKREQTEKKRLKHKKFHQIEATVEQTKDSSKMITLRNPMFQQFQNPNTSGPFTNNDESLPASIFTNENGMVTIRSSRLQQNIQKGKSNLASASVGIMPSLLAEMTTNNSNQYTVETNLTGGFENVSTLNAQEILSGLPGIEITKIDRKSDKNLLNDTCPGAEVSIIPANINGCKTQSINNEEWMYDNVFQPKEILEDDMDDDELEVEAFKRFCQQSIPPREKKRVKLNVADIVLNKKTT